MTMEVASVTAYFGNIGTARATVAPAMIARSGFHRND
jgi:hypothetical protein